MRSNGKYAYQIGPESPVEFVQRLEQGYYDAELRDHDAVLHTLDASLKVGRANKTALHIEVLRDNGTTRYYELVVVPCVSFDMKVRETMPAHTEYVQSCSESGKHPWCYRVTLFPNMLHYKSMGQYIAGLNAQERVMAVIGGAIGFDTLGAKLRGKAGGMHFSPFVVSFGQACLFFWGMFFFVGFLLLSMLNQLFRRLCPCGLLKRFDTDEERRSVVTLRGQNTLKTLRTWKWTSVLLITDYLAIAAWCALPCAVL